MQIILKIIFTVVILFVCIFLLGMNNMLVMTNTGFGGALSMMIIGGATFAAIRAVWKYKRKDKEVSSNMPKLDKDA